jgi:DNA-binding PadR family transcriptional regulator
VPKNALDNPLVLPILGLLVEQPRHPYAVYAELRRRYPYLHVRNATVYTLLTTLETTGWTRPHGGQDRESLTVTEAGAAALARQVRANLETGDLAGGQMFLAALAYLAILPPEVAADVLRTRADRVDEERAHLQETMSTTDALEIHMIEVQYLVNRLDHDATWLRKTAERIETTRLTWP